MNRKANQCLHSTLAATEAEIEVFTGMLIVMGITKMPRYRMYWANQTRFDAVANCMSRNRFETLLRFLHFNDDDKVIMDRNYPMYDRFYKVRPLLENIRKTCLEETPGELQSVDEHIIPYKGRCKMNIHLHYNPKRPCKWGLKLFARCGKNGFVHDFWLCDRMAPKVENPVGFFGMNVVMKTSRPPADSIECTKRRGRGSIDFRRTNDNKLCVVKWFDNREVILSSTYKCVDPVEPVRRWDKMQRQFIDVPSPAIVREYNQFMGGVDLTESITSAENGTDEYFLGNPRVTD
ncbi:PiggyBac transposable element-derived protein 3 [Trichinella nelsoni]|uniref:PiggyBac transposable element-derived protein 3 n=1 Tax=Trichinella nelsoni TaxID=6336 RepID=A0A0V0SBR8_9BILA|nr:PiggyBac transposable element-derived protein 3 [Trichinella nelsoni]